MVAAVHSGQAAASHSDNASHDAARTTPIIIGVLRFHRVLIFMATVVRPSQRPSLGIGAGVSSLAPHVPRPIALRAPPPQRDCAGLFHSRPPQLTYVFEHYRLFHRSSQRELRRETTCCSTKPVFKKSPHTDLFERSCVHQPKMSQAVGAGLAPLTWRSVEQFSARLVCCDTNTPPRNSICQAVRAPRRVTW